MVGIVTYREHQRTDEYAEHGGPYMFVRGTHLDRYHYNMNPSRSVRKEKAITVFLRGMERHGRIHTALSWMDSARKRSLCL